LSYNSTLQLLERGQPHGARLPIDIFLRSLAQDQGSNAIGVILSGTGTDGTLGLRAIKGEAGITMVQEPDSAKYDGMPRNAIATGLVDYVLPPDKMPEQLTNYVHHRKKSRGSETVDGDDSSRSNLQKILMILRSRTDQDVHTTRVTPRHTRGDAGGQLKRSTGEAGGSMGW